MRAKRSAARNFHLRAFSIRIELMKIAPFISVFLLLSVGAFWLGCNRQPAENSVVNQAYTPNENANQSSNVTKDDAELGLIVKLPFEPEEAVWREESLAAKNPANRAPVQTGKKLIAVVKFSAENSSRVVEQAQTYGAPQSVKIGTEIWFPAELIALSELSGDETLKGNSYAANDFFQPPYAEGKITRIENSDFFVLELTAK